MLYRLLCELAMRGRESRAGTGGGDFWWAPLMVDRFDCDRWLERVVGGLCLRSRKEFSVDDDLLGCWSCVCPFSPVSLLLSELELSAARFLIDAFDFRWKLMSLRNEGIVLTRPSSRGRSVSRSSRSKQISAAKACPASSTRPPPVSKKKEEEGCYRDGRRSPVNTA